MGSDLPDPRVRSHAAQPLLPLSADIPAGNRSERQEVEPIQVLLTKRLALCAGLFAYKTNEREYAMYRYERHCTTLLLSLFLYAAVGVLPSTANAAKLFEEVARLHRLAVFSTTLETTIARAEKQVLYLLFSDDAAFFRVASQGEAQELLNLLARLKTDAAVNKELVQQIEALEENVGDFSRIFDELYADYTGFRVHYADNIVPAVEIVETRLEALADRLARDADGRAQDFLKKGRQ
jgi:hypothetical protein